MLNKIPLKNEYLLAIATLILLLVSYQLAFKATFAAWNTNSQLKNQLEQNTNLSYQPGYLERKNINLNKVINLYKADTVAFRNNIISTISLIAQKENVKLSEVPIQDPFYHTNHFILQKLNFEGDFFALTRMLNTLQLTGDIGVIRSLGYKLTGEATNSTNDKKLVLEVYLEVTK